MNFASSSCFTKYFHVVSDLSRNRNLLSQCFDCYYYFSLCYNQLIHCRFRDQTVAYIQTIYTRTQHCIIFLRQLCFDFPLLILPFVFFFYFRRTSSLGSFMITRSNKFISSTRHDNGNVIVSKQLKVTYSIV